jgi:hypothetical protein
MTQPKDADNLDFELIETDEKLKNLTGQLKSGYRSGQFSPLSPAGLPDPGFI